MMLLTVYEARDPAKPSRQFVGVIDWNGYRGNRHICTFTFGPTEEEARRKGQAFIDSTMEKIGKSKMPTDADSVPPTDLDYDLEPV